MKNNALKFILALVLCVAAQAQTGIQGVQVVIAGGGSGGGGGGGGNNTWTGSNGFTGQLYRNASTMNSSTIDITKAAMNRTLTASETESFSATPATDLQEVVYYTTTGGPWTVTWGSVVYSYGRQGDISGTGMIIPANGTYAVTYNYSLSRAQWEIRRRSRPCDGYGKLRLVRQPDAYDPRDTQHAGYQHHLAWLQRQPVHQRYADSSL